MSPRVRRPTVRKAAPFPDRMSELNDAYGRGVMFALFDAFDPTRNYRYLSRTQFYDQLHAGIRTGECIKRGGAGWPR